MLANFFNEISTNVHRDKWLKGGYHFYLRFLGKALYYFQDIKEIWRNKDKEKLFRSYAGGKSNRHVTKKDLKLF